MDDLDEIPIQRPLAQPSGLDPDLALHAGNQADTGQPLSEGSAGGPSPAEAAPDAALEPPSEDRPASGKSVPIAVLAIVFLLALAAAYYWWQRSPSVPELGIATPRQEAEVAAPEPLPREPATASDPDFELPELSASDQVVRTLAAALSQNPRVAEWLVNDDLLRRFTLVVANVAYDETPAVHVPFLRPDGRFEARADGEGFVVGAESYRRYDTLVEAFTSVDPQGAGDLYRRLEPLIEQQYAELGYPGRFASAMRRAALRVLETPIPSGEVALQPWIRGYRFADPELESLAPVQKQLLRMGPSHQRRVQQQVRRLLTEIDRAIE